MKKMLGEMIHECVVCAYGVGSQKATVELNPSDDNVVRYKRRRSELRGMLKMIKIACAYTDSDYDAIKKEINAIRDNGYNENYKWMSK